MNCTARVHRNTWSDWFLGGMFSLLALFHTARLEAEVFPTWWHWVSPALFGFLGVSCLFSAGFRSFDSIVCELNFDRWKIVVNKKTVYEGPPLTSGEVIEDGVALNLCPKSSWKTTILRKKSLPSEMIEALIGKKGGEPGATDNPDDAQRLREDH